MDERKTIARLSGYPLVGSPSWSFTTGVSAHQEIVEMHVKHANSLMRDFAGKNIVELNIVAAGLSAGSAGELSVSDLRIVDKVPSSTPYSYGLVIADRRWNWPKKYVVRRYNVTRKTGNMRLSSDNALGAVSLNIADIGFARWSLKGGHAGRPWKASEILLDVLKRVDPNADVIKHANIMAWDEVQILDLELDDTGDSALSRVLSNMNGLDLYIDKNGAIVIYNRLDGGESVLFNIKSGPLAGPPIAGMGVADVVDHRVQRPQSINVYFNREIELRFDYIETSGTVALDGGVATFENVMPSPDLDITIGGRRVLRGEWVTINNDLFNAWAPTTPLGETPLTRARLLAQWYGDLLNQYALVGRFTYDAVWGARISTLKQHFRRTFRIPREWMDRIYQIKDKRVAVFDEETGTSAGSPVWMDHTLIFDRMRPVVVSGVGDAIKFQTVYDIAVRGYAQRLISARTAPVDLTILDQDLGIVGISFLGDPAQLYVDLIPGVFVIPPLKDPTAVGAARFRGELVRLGNFPGGVSLSPEFGMSTIITAAFGAPNDESQLQMITITAEEAEARVRDAKFLPAVGPPQDLRIGSSIMSAKFAWRDVAGMANKVKLAVGVDGPDQSTARGFELVNEWINKEECKAVALAFAASFYAGLQDRIGGTKTTGLNASAFPLGATDSVEHRVNSDGSPTTTVSAPIFVGTKIDPFSLMPPSVRRTIRREVF